MKRRQFLGVLGLTSLATMGFRFWPDQGIWNPCLNERLPASLKNNELIAAAWQGLDATLVWDSHVHLIGTGDTTSGIWVNPNMQSLMHPVQFTQFKFYLNASCVDQGDKVDVAYVNRLLNLQRDFHPGFRVMLLAFDYRHDENGQIDKQNSPFYVPNEYAAAIKQAHPNVFEWVASIHPYREDSIEALEWAVSHGARAIKWLPGAMGIDPSSKQCDRFYQALFKYNIPLLTHAGEEQAVDVAESHHLNNPLLLRRPLEQGIRVIVGHCASIGESEDIEHGEHAPTLPNIELFARLMDDNNYKGNLFADISAITQVNRDLDVIARIIKQTDWHPRLINGSDYPLPGVMPVFSLRRFIEVGYLKVAEAETLSQVRRYNPLLFDFLLKRRLRVDGQRLSDVVFESGRVFSQ